MATDGTFDNIAKGQLGIDRMSQMTKEFLPRLSADKMLDRVLEHVDPGKFHGDYSQADEPRYYQLLDYWAKNDAPMDEAVGLDERKVQLENALLTHEPAFWDDYTKGDYEFEEGYKDLFWARMLLKFYGSPAGILQKLGDYKAELNPSKLAETRRLVVSLWTWVDETYAKLPKGKSGVRIALDPNVKTLMQENLLPLLDKESMAIDNPIGTIIARTDLFADTKEMPDNILWYCLDSENMSGRARIELTRRMNEGNKDTIAYLTEKFSALPLEHKYDYFWRLTEAEDFGKNLSLWPVMAARINSLADDATRLPEHRTIDKNTSDASKHIAVGLDKMIQQSETKGGELIKELGGLEQTRHLLNNLLNLFPHISHYEVHGKIFRQALSALIHSVSSIEPKVIFSWKHLVDQVMNLSKRTTFDREKTIGRDISERESYLQTRRLVQGLT